MLLVGLLVAIWWDLRARRVPNIINLSIALAGLTAQICLSAAPGIVTSMAGIWVALGILIVPFYLGVYRGGDVKLMMAVGAWLGPMNVLWATLLGVVLGGITAVGMLIIRPRLRFLIRKGEVAIESRPKTAHVPMALAFGTAACLSMWIEAPWLP